MTTYDPYNTGSKSFNQPSPGTAPKVIKGLAKKGVPRQVTGASNQNADKPLIPGHPKNPNAPINLTVPSQGGRVNPAKAAATKAAKSTGKKKNPNGTPSTPGTTAPSTVPSIAALTPEDAALQAAQVPNNPGYGAAGNGGTNLASQFDPMGYAKGMAGMQFDPQITQMAQRIKGIIAALPGSLESLHTAFGNLDRQAANPAVVSPVGSGTAAQNAYAAQSANLNNSLSASQAAGNASREADWGERIKALSAANVNDLRGQLGGLTQSKADAQVGYYNQGVKTKSDLVSQAIANINSIRASNDAEALTKGNLTGQGLKNQAQFLQNQNQGIQNTFAPYQENQQLQQGANTITAGNLSIAQAKTNLKQTAGTSKNLASALSAGGPQAIQSLTSLVIPSGSLVQDANGYTHVRGDPNTWVKNGVAQIMRTLPQSKRANVVKFVNSQISQAIAPAGGWKQVNGKWKRPK